MVEACGSDCAAYCTSNNCPLNAGAIITKDTSVNGEYTAVVASTVGKPSIVVSSISIFNIGNVYNNRSFNLL